MKHIYIYIDMLHNITYRIRLEDVALVSFLVNLLNYIDSWLQVHIFIYICYETYIYIYIYIYIYASQHNISYPSRRCGPCVLSSVFAEFNRILVTYKFNKFLKF